MAEEEIVDEGEEDFIKWLESISFVDEEGIQLPVELKDDDSEDPEGDRAEEEKSEE